MNEGFDTLSFLFYPGWETWLQSALLLAFSILVLRRRVGLLDSLVQDWRRFAILLWAFILVGALVGFWLVAEYTVGERKWATYVFAPRALSSWLALAIAILVFPEYFGRTSRES